jgi:cytochrome c-type biogenesis protein CcmF
VDPSWARWLRPWVLVAWIALTLGIALGSWWAYYELGWGGWWFWDPVENASLMPWLAGTALLHSAIVVEKRNTLKIWTILLAIIAFSLSLIGTFLVRSGVLSSVHAFAVDPQRGVFILMILLFFIGGSFILYAAKAGTLKTGGLFAPISREGALVVNNLLMSAAAAAVFIGTLFPLAYEAMTGGGKITVGAPYFNFTFGILMIPLLLLIPVGPMLSWKRADLFAALQRLSAAAGIALIVAIAVAAAAYGHPVMAALGIALGAWIIAGALEELAIRVKLFHAPFSTSLRRLWNLPGQVLGMTLAHMGMGLVVLGIIASSTWKEEVITSLQPGQVIKAGGYEVKYLDERREQGPDYIAEQARFQVSKDGKPIRLVTSEKRSFIPRGMPTTEVGLLHFFKGDLYVAIGDRDSKGRVVRVYFHPFIYLMWFGALFMAFGGLVSLLDRRFRVGVAKKAGRSAAAQPAE